MFIRHIIVCQIAGIDLRHLIQPVCGSCQYGYEFCPCDVIFRSESEISVSLENLYGIGSKIDVLLRPVVKSIIVYGYCKSRSNG